MKSARKQRAKEIEFKHAPVAKPQAGTTTGVFRWLLPALVVCLTVFAFLPSLRNGFVNWDDDHLLLQNPYYRGLGWTQVQWMFTTFHASLYRPLTWMTFGLDYLLWGMNPIGYHLTNLIIHALNAVLFFFVALRLLDLAAVGVARSREFSLRLAAGFAALIFAIHPLRVESVAWISARNDVVAGLFFLWALLCYLRATTASESQRGRFGWMAAAVIIYGLSLLAKGIGLMLPVVLLILDIYPLRRLTGNPRNWFAPPARAIWWEKVPFLVLALGAGALAVGAKQKYGLVVPVAEYGLFSRLATAVYGPIFYVGKTILPAGLSPYVPLPMPFDPWSWPFLLSGLAVLILSAGLFAARHRWPAGLATWACYAALLVPVLGIVQIGPQLVADRYSYLSCLGWAVLAGAGLLYCWDRRANEGIGRATFALVGGFAGVLLVGFGILTWEQAKVWRDSETLWRYTLGIQESNIGHTNLGIVLAEQGRLEEAIEHYHKSLLMNPNDANTHNNLGNALTARGETEAAIKQYQQTVRINPKDSNAQSNLGLALAKRGRWEEAVEHLREALRISPNDANAHNNFGIALALRGQTDEALSHNREAVRINPDLANAHYNLGLVLASRGQWGEAIEHYREVLRLKPTDAEAHNKLGAALAKEGRFSESIEYLRKALELESSAAVRMETHFYLGIAVAKQGHLEEAREHFEQALKIRPDFVEAQHYLGRVWAAEGNLNKAIEYFRQAIRLEPEFAEAHQSLGEALEEQGNRDEAAKQFQIVSQLLKSRRKVSDGR